MIFAPHILQVKVITPMDKDEFGRPIPGTGGESWQEVCKCRCDDNTTKEFSSDNGSVYRPNYHRRLLSQNRPPFENRISQSCFSSAISISC